MSLVLMFIYWVAIPVFALYAGRGLLRRARKPYARVLLKFIGAALFLGWFWLILGKQLWLDHQVRELCAKDGGIRVYETVTLPTEKFNQWGQVNFERPTQGANALGPEYLVKDMTNHLLGGEKKKPVIRQFHYQVFRRTDGKLLGESITYGRTGSNLPGPWHPSSFICPDSQESVLKFIFIKSNAKGDKQ